MTTAIPARCPTPVAPLPPWGSGPTLPLSVPKTLPFSMPKTLPFSMPIDTTASWSFVVLHVSLCGQKE